MFIDKLELRLRRAIKSIFLRLKAYIKRLLFPLYLFPLKLVTYSAYYSVKFLIKLVIALIKIIIDAFIFSFKSLKNFLKSLFVLGLVIYMVASLFVIMDYLRTQYGYYGKFLCSFGVQDKLKGSVVRVVGGYSEGSGFFITENQILTNFHVIADEPSPKVIFPDGSFITPNRILGDRDADLALLFTEDHYPNLVLPILKDITFRQDEPLIATGYPMGTELSGKATVLKGNFVDFRNPKSQRVGYIQTNISLVEGMSGGPLTDQCGQVVGINTIGLAGLSLFIDADHARIMVPLFTDQEITKIEVDPSASPEEAVKAFYTYLKARKMKEGFELLSQEYLQKTNFEEWTNRFVDILDVNIFLSERYENSEDTVFVKFGTKNWVDGEVEIHYYEGTWQTVLEDGVYKMLKSKIKEVENPEWDWFYSSD
ncbi:MAG TPA: serine protease [Patescibacteria group bacterium]|nr:serine protease [Patescibacteria group bacterium]